MLPPLRQRGEGRVNTDEAPSDDSAIKKNLVCLNVHEVPSEIDTGELQGCGRCLGAWPSLPFCTALFYGVWKSSDPGTDAGRYP
jgi:hypothetical protein